MNMSSRNASGRRVVIIGGGLTGTLAAAVLAEHAEQVVVIERDPLPEGPLPRRGMPQAQHAHVMWSGGARAVERILPGILDEWMAAGARRIPLPQALVSMTPQGWFRRWPVEMQFLISCSRDLLDWCIRRRVLELGNVTVREQSTVSALIGDAGQVRGTPGHRRAGRRGPAR